MCYNKYKYKRIWRENIERLTLVYGKIIDWSLHTNCIDILISSLLFDFNNDILINSGVDQVRKLVKADKMAFIVFGFDRQNGTYCVILSFIIIRTKYSVIASGNKGTPRDTVYPWGKGVCKHKTGDCRLRQSTGQKRSIRRISRNGYEIAYKYGLFIKLSKGHSC